MTLIVIGIGWVTGLVAVGTFGAPWWMGAAWILVAVPAFKLVVPSSASYPVAVVSIACALAGGWLLDRAALEEPAWLALAGKDVTLTGKVISEPDRGTTTTGYVVGVTAVEAGGVAFHGGQVLVFFLQYAEYLPGDRITVEGELDLPPRFEGFDYQSYLASRGIWATMLRPRVVEDEPGGASLRRWLTDTRLKLDRSLQRALPEQEASLGAGIAFGRDDGLSMEAKQQYNRSGLRHLVAVSGSNVALVTMLTYALAIPTVGRKWAWLPAVLTIAAYLGAAGLSPSVLRAGLMACVLLAGSVIGRPQSGLPALFGAVIAMTAFQPRLALEPGFQLSATATAALITLSPWIRHTLLSATSRSRWLAAPVWACDAVALTTAASVGTLPVMWVTFGEISLVSPLANLVVQPVFAFAFWASISTAALGLVSREAGEFAGLVAYYPLALIGECASIFSSQSFATVSAPSIAVEFATGTYVLLAAIAILAYRFVPAPLEELPRIRSGRQFATRLVLAGSAGALALAVIPVSLLSRHGPGELVVAFLDIGQGDAVLITTPRGNQILIDGGPSGVVLARELGEVMPHWDRRLDAIVLTHPQEDHMAGFPEILNRMRVGVTYTNGIGNDTSAFREFRFRANNFRELSAGDRFELDGVKFEVVWPPPGFEDDDLNNTSLVIRLTYEDVTFLFTGDSEAVVHEQLVQSAVLQADILKVPHHGSKTTEAWFFDAVSPSVAVISVGSDNRFGHPHPDTLAALAGVRTFRTDVSGRVTVRTDGDRVAVATER